MEPLAYCPCALVSTQFPDAHGADRPLCVGAEVEPGPSHVGRDDDNLGSDGQTQHRRGQILVDDGFHTAKCAIFVAHNGYASPTGGGHEESGRQEGRNRGGVENLQWWRDATTRRQPLMPRSSHTWPWSIMSRAWAAGR
jgi:hypothetical protein